MSTGLELVSGALLADVAGCLLAEGGVLGSQAGDFLACGVEAGAERFGGGVVSGYGAAAASRAHNSHKP